MKKMRKACIAIGCAVFIIFVSMLSVMAYRTYTSGTPFDCATWNRVEDLFHSEEKYDMALWLMKHYDFMGKSIEEIRNDLCGGKPLHGAVANDLLSIPLRNKGTRIWFFKYFDETHQVIDAYMNIYFKDSCVVRVEIVELRNHEWHVVKSAGG